MTRAIGETSCIDPIQPPVVRYLPYRCDLTPIPGSCLPQSSQLPIQRTFHEVIRRRCNILYIIHDSLTSFQGSDYYCEGTACKSHARYYHDTFKCYHDLSSQYGCVEVSSPFKRASLISSMFMVLVSFLFVFTISCRTSPGLKHTQRHALVSVQRWLAILSPSPPQAIPRNFP